MINKEEKCDIVEDLLPLYVEKLTQEETNQWIQQHFLECEQCKEKYQWMKSSFTEVLKEETKTKDKKIKSLKKVKLRLLIGGYVLFLILVFLYCMLDFIFFF